MDDCYEEDCELDFEFGLDDCLDYADYVFSDESDEDNNEGNGTDVPLRTFNSDSDEIENADANVNAFINDPEDRLGIHNIMVLTEDKLFNDAEAFDRMKEIIMNDEEMVSTECIDAVILLAQRKGFEMISTEYNQWCERDGSSVIPPATEKISYAIIGGTEAIQHFRLVRRDGENIYIYDSLKHHYGGLKKGDLNFIKGRFPTVKSKNVTFKNMKTIQKDGFSCGLYAVANLIYCILSGDPTNIKFSNNTMAMRRHYLKILNDRELSNFPIKQVKK